MVKMNKSGNLVWSKEERNSLLTFFEENPDPSLSERLKLANSLGIHVRKVTNWFRGRRTKMKRGLNVPNLFKRKNKSRKEDSEKTSDLKTQLLKYKSEDQKSGVLFTEKKSSKMLKSSNETSCLRPTEPVAHNVSLKSDTDANFLDRSSCNYVNDDSPTNQQDLQHKLSLPPRVETKQVVDFRNIESLISKESNVDVITLKPEMMKSFWPASTFYPKTLIVENDDLEEILDLHVQMITEDNFDDNDDLNAYQPITETNPIFL